MKKTLLLSALLALFFAQPTLATPPKKYIVAGEDAAIADANEVVNNLVAVDINNNSLVWNADKTMIKVVTWKSQKSYEQNLLPYTQTSANEAYVVWVTLAPKIQHFCHHYLTTHPHATTQHLDYRLKQRLGLDPDWQYDVFVELWVNPADLFRPCVDPATNDTSCNLAFGGTVPVVKNIRDYPAFYKNLYFNDFRTAPQVPWTGFGYTYDWSKASKLAGASEEGESEFILSPSSSYTIDNATPTWQYCTQ